MKRLKFPRFLAGNLEPLQVGSYFFDGLLGVSVCFASSRPLPSDTDASISCRSRSRLPLFCFHWMIGSMETKRWGRENVATGESKSLDM